MIVVGAEAVAPHTSGSHAEVPVMIGELVQRSIVHTCQQGRFRGFALVVLHVDGPGLFAAGVELVAYGGQGDVEVEVIVRYADVLAVGLVAVFLDEGGDQGQAATVFLGDIVADLLDVVVQGNPTFQTDFIVVFQPDPHLHILGRATDVEMDGLARMCRA